MNQVSSIMRRGRDRFFHWCPACEQLHPIPDEGWENVGTPAAPTFLPSFKTTLVRWQGGGIGEGEPIDVVCHYTITNGTIQFHPDSWHKRSDIVAMPPIPAHVADFASFAKD